MTTDQINGIETNGLTVAQLAEQLAKKTGCEVVAQGFRININEPREEIVELDAQGILDEVGSARPLFSRLIAERRNSEK